MRIKLEEYLKKNRLRMDVEEPDEAQIWKNIRSKQNSRKSFRLGPVFKVAAIGLFFLLSYYFVKHELLPETGQIDRLGQIDRDLGRKEQNYQRKINAKWNEINSMDRENQVMEGDYMEHLKLLDTLYRQALDDLNTYGDNERIVRLIFDTYEKKLKLLETIIMEEQKQIKTEKDEKGSLL